MTPFRVTIIGIPQQVWERVPCDRPFVALALDAEGAARRIFKGVNERLERRRFSQLCGYIESAALDLVQASGGQGIEDRRFAGVSLENVRSIRLDDNRNEVAGSAYLGVLEARGAQEQDARNVVQLFRTVFPPGRSVQEYVTLLNDADSLASLEASPEKRAATAAIVMRVCNFLRTYEPEYDGIVQVVSVLPS